MAMTPIERTFVYVVAAEIAARLGGNVGMGEALAAKLWGMIEERNGASIEEIVKAATEAELNAVDPADVIETPDEPERSANRQSAIAAFFRAIAREALGEGKVFDEYAEFRTYRSPNASVSRPFSVPRLNIEGAQS